MADFWGELIKYAPTVIETIGAYNAKKNATSAARTASRSEEALRGQTLDVRNRQLDIAERADQRSQQLFDEFGSSFLPAQKRGLAAQTEVLDLASRPIDPNVESGLASADYAAADDAARGTLRRRQQAVGIAPNSGQALEQERLTGLSSVAGKAAAGTSARRSATNTRIARMSAAAAPLTNAGNSLMSGAGAFSSAANTGANQAAAGLGDLAGDYGADADQASAVAGKAGATLGGSLSDLATDLYNRYRAGQLQPVNPTVKPLPVEGSGPGTFSAAGGGAANGAKSFGFDPEASGLNAKIGSPDGYQFLGGPATISTGLQDLDFAKSFGAMNDAQLADALGSTGAMNAIGGANAAPSVASRVGGGVGGALGIYGGLRQGGVAGYGQAATGAAQLASAAGVGGSLATSAVPVLGAVTGAYNTIKAINAGDVKGGAASGAATGAAAGSIIPGVGTIIGGVVGAVVGALGAVIHGKDYAEEKVTDTYYDGVSKGMTVNDSLTAIDPKAFYQAVAGEFRRSRSKYPPRLAGYGQKDEDVFINDMKSKVQAAYANGTLKQGDNAQTIVDRVIDPWFQEMGGYQGDPRYPDLIKQQKQMTLDLVNRYISGSPVDWNVITGGR